MKKKLPQRVWARVLDSTAASPKRSKREKSAQANHHWCRVYSRLVNNVTEKFSINQGRQGAYHLSELPGQTSPIVKRITLSIRTIHPDQPY